jgi:hypothetical protein
MINPTIVEFIDEEKNFFVGLANVFKKFDGFGNKFNIISKKVTKPVSSYDACKYVRGGNIIQKYNNYPDTRPRSRTEFVDSFDAPIISKSRVGTILNRENNKKAINEMKLDNQNSNLFSNNTMLANQCNIIEPNYRNSNTGNNFEVNFNQNNYNQIPEKISLGINQVPNNNQIPERISLGINQFPNNNQIPERISLGISQVPNYNNQVFNFNNNQNIKNQGFNFNDNQNIQNQGFNFNNFEQNNVSQNNNFDGFMNFNNNFSNVNIRGSDPFDMNRQQNNFNFNQNDVAYGVSGIPKNNPSKPVNNDPKKAIDDIFNDLF